MTGISRSFLGWDQPVLEAIADELVRAVPEGHLLDLSEILLVLPGAQAGRRLKEVLLERADAAGRALRPPDVQGVGRLPERLYHPELPQPGPVLGRLAWHRALEDQGKQLRILIPDVDIVGGRASIPSALVGAVRTLGRDIGAAGRTFHDVWRLCAEHDSHSDEERWALLADVQKRYWSLLQEAGFQDASQARAEALERGDVTLAAHLWIAGVPELPVVTRAFVNALAETVVVRVLVAAPGPLEARFDALGCVIPTAWIDAPVEIPDAAIEVGAGPADQAEAAVRAIRSLGEGTRAEDITIGVPDPEVIPFLVERLEEEGIRARDIGGKALEETGTFRLLRGIERYLAAPGVRPLENLLRHPAFEQAVARSADLPGSPSDLIARYQGTHFQRVLVEDDLPTDGESTSAPIQPLVRDLIRAVDELLEPLSGSRSLSEWVPGLARLLRDLFGESEEDAAMAPGEVSALEEAIGSILGEVSGLPPALDAAVSAPEAIGALLEEIRDSAIPPPVDSAAIPLTGWLELALDDAPDLIVTGFNEPFVPASVGADAFLPHGLRRAVGLADNDARWARDAWILSTVLNVRRNVTLVVGRRGAEGDPLLPSRLLFATDPRTVARRMARLLGGALDDGDAAGSDAADDEASDIAAADDDASGGSALYDEASNSAATDDDASDDGPAGGGLTADPGSAGGDAPSSFRLPPEPVLSAPTPPDRIGVTHFRKLLRDPYAYALTDVLRLREVELDPDEMDPLSFGNLAHEVLRAFGEGPAAAAVEPDVIRAFLDETLDILARRRFGTRHLAAVRLQIGQLRARFRAFADWQARWRREGWHIRATECSPREGGVPFDVDGESILLRGKIDRIDENAETGTWALLDYKTGERGEGPSTTHRPGRGGDAPWVDLQLPLYRLLAAAIAGPDGDLLIPRDRLADLRVGYVILPRDLSKVGGEMADWGPADYAAAEDTARDVVRMLRANRFVFDPRTSRIDSRDFLSDVVGAGVLSLPSLEGGEDVA